MVMKQVVVLHGWSDDSDSFKPLIAFLKKNGFNVTTLFLGDYVSLRDDVRIEDVGRRMEEVIREKMAKPASAKDRLEPTFDLVVHSTGGLLARWWISEYYKDRKCPVRNLVMLAPANFGSVLAHTGRSMLGRLFKGFKTGFEVGEEMLHSLELASAFQGDLADRDLFRENGSDSTVFYAPDKVRLFVITGTHPYGGRARKLINENGSDGTVRVAAANMNARGVTVDFTTSLTDPDVRPWRRRGGANQAFALAVLPDRDHSNVTRPADKGYATDATYRGQLGAVVLSALSTNTASQYATRVKEWEQISLDTRTFAGAGKDAKAHRKSIFGKDEPEAEYFHEHYQLVIEAVDQYGAPVPEYFVEFFPKPSKLKSFSSFNKASLFFHDEVIEDIHVNRRTPHRRCFFIDRYDMMCAGGFYAQIPSSGLKSLAMTITATDPGDNVSYFKHGEARSRGVVQLHGKLQADRWLKRHSTHFIRIIVPRIGSDKLFRLKKA